MEQTCAVAVVGEGREVRQPGGLQRHGIAVRIGYGHWQLNQSILLHALRVDEWHHRGAVGVADGDRHIDDGGQGWPSAIAVVGGGETHRVGPGLVESRSPVKHGGVEIEVRTGRQAAHAVGHARQAALERGQCTGAGALRQLEAGVVGVEREGAERQQLPFKGNPGTQLVEHRGRVDVEHHQLHHHGRCAVAVIDLELESVPAGLVERRNPGEDTGVRVEEAARRRHVVAEGECVALGVAGHQRKPQRVTLADGAVGDVADRRRLVALLDRQGEAVGAAVQAVADVQRDIVVHAGRVVARQPFQRLGIDIEHRAGGQVVGVVHHVLALRILGAERERERLALAQRVARREVAKARRQIHSGDVDGERLLGKPATPVVHAQHHAGLLRAAQGGRPRHQPAGGGHGHAIGGLHQHVAEKSAVRIGGQSLVGVRGSHLGCSCRPGIEAWRIVRVRQRIHAVPQVGALVAGCGHGNGPGRDRVAHFEHSASQGAGQVDQPQAQAAELRTDRLAGKVLAGVDHQRQRRTQVVLADVGHRHVVRHRASGAVGAGRGKTDRHMVREVEQRGEAGLVDLFHAQVLVTPEAGGHAQGVFVGVKTVKGQERGAAVGVVGHRADQDRPATGADQRVVVGVEHRASLVGSADVHVVVEHHADPAHRQRHYRMVDRAGRHHLGCDQRRDHIDLVRLPHQQPAVLQGIHSLAARTTARHGHRVQGGQIDHHQFAARAAWHRVVGHEQQSSQLGARPAKRQRVDLGFQPHL